MTDFEQAQTILNTALGDRRPFAQVKREAEALGDTRRVVAVSDLHNPFTRLDQVAEICRRHAGADKLVIAGDLDDGYAVSRFMKYQDVPYLKGLAYSKVVLETLSQHFPQIDLMEGNHDGPRFEKRLRSEVSGDVLEAIKFLTGGELSPIRALAKQFPNVQLVNTTKVPWLHQVGDVVFSHYEKYSRVPGNAVRATFEHLENYAPTFGLKPFRVIVQAHTHQLSWFPYRADKLLVESGCLSRVPEYALDAKGGGVPQRNGYVTMTFDRHWKVHLASVRPHWF